ncbi:unnamed protein product [Calypogeia fissa]
MDPAIEAQDKGAPNSMVRAVSDGAGIPVEPNHVERGSDGGGPQRTDHIWQPLEVESKSKREHDGNYFNHPSLPKGKELLRELHPGAAMAVGTSGKSEEVSVSTIVDNQNGLDQDIEKGNVHNAHSTPSLEGRSAVEMQTIKAINHILPPLIVAQSDLEQQQAGNAIHPHPSKGIELLCSCAAAADDRREKNSRVAIAQDCNSDIPDVDIEKGKVYNVHAEAIAGRDVEAGPKSYFQQPDMEDSDSICRICYMNSATAEIVNLGCACKLDLGQAHKRCADTWFAFKGNRQCEICGEIARSVKPPEIIKDSGNLDDHQPDHTVVILNIHYREFARWVCIRLVVICLLWVAVVFLLYKILVPNFKKAADKGNSF